MENAMRRLLTLACLIGVPAIVAASTIYKVQMPDGSIMYTDTVPAGGKILEERETKARPRAVPAAPRAVPAEGAPGRVIAPALSPREADKLDTAVNEIAEAERALAVSRRKLELGREPLPGERLGLAGGGSRLSPEYEARQRVLEAEVSSAEMRLKRAYEARNAARQ
jgi:hypothetical protein